MENSKDNSTPWDVFLYEVYMYFYMYVRVYNSRLKTNGQRNRARHNSHVESLLLHTRILSEIFLYTRKAQSDDILLDQLVDPSIYPKSLNSLINKLNFTYNKNDISPRYQINKLLVHATYLRKSHYNYDDLISVLHPLLFGIISEIQSCTKDKTLKKHISYYSKNMKSYITAST